MSKYSLTLVGNNQASPMFKGAAADVGDLTAGLRQQQQAAKALDRTQGKLGKFEDLREGMAASRAELAKTHTKMRGLAAQQDEARVAVAQLVVIEP